VDFLPRRFPSIASKLASTQDLANIEISVPVYLEVTDDIPKLM
jgi:hypothetical protein